MNTAWAWVATFAKWLWSAIFVVIVGTPLAIKILVLVSIAEFLSSIGNPKVQLKTLSRQMALMFLLVGTVHIVYGMAQKQSGLNVGFDITTVVCSFYCVQEMVAFIKNCDAAGLGIPPALIAFIEKADGLTGQDRKDIMALSIKHGEQGIALELKHDQAVIAQIDKIEGGK